jgi:enoyl-CoA hydratase/carnithine racemase
VTTREDSGDIAILRLAHGKVNALDVALCDAIVQELHAIAAGDWRALVLTGTGSAFSAGVDLFQVLNGGEAYLSRFLPAMEKLFRALLEFPKPAVAAINGHAIAGGCIMAAACDHRIMSAGTARIGIPELAVGVPFPALPFEIVGARVSAQHFRHLVLSGRTVEPAEALHLGLVDEVVPADALATHARRAAEQLTQIPAITFQLTKRTFNAPVLERVRTAAALNAEAVAAWASLAVQSRIREYLEQTIGKK